MFNLYHVVLSEMKMMDGHMMPANDSIAMMMMQMTFYAGVDCTVLINQWKVCLFYAGVDCSVLINQWKVCLFYAGVDCTVLINQWKVCLFYAGVDCTVLINQ